MRCRQPHPDATSSDSGFNFIEIIFAGKPRDVTVAISLILMQQLQTQDLISLKLLSGLRRNFGYTSLPDNMQTKKQAALFSTAL
jgi:hypothetical protein